MPPADVSLFNRGGGPPLQDAAANRLFVTRRLPFDIFKPTVNSCTLPGVRWVYTDLLANYSVLVFTDGSSPGNGQPGARGGCGVVYDFCDQSGVSFPLEKAPDGSPPTSNRAELRAAIAALTIRYWPGEGFSRLVVGTDSEYVVKGVTEWTKKWKENGWRTASGGLVKNRDLWEILLKKVEGFESKGFIVQFFHLRREWNTLADACAKRGAVSVFVLRTSHIHSVNGPA